MTALRAPPARPGWIDHVFAFLGTLAGAAATGAALVLLASLIERWAGPPQAAGPLALLWTLGVVTMHAPVTGWPLAAAGGALFHLALRAGWGGWAVAAGIGGVLALAATAGLDLPAVDRGIRTGIGAAMGLGYRAILAYRRRLSAR